MTPHKERKSFKKFGLKQTGPTYSRALARSKMPKSKRMRRRQHTIGVPVVTNKPLSRRDRIRLYGRSEARKGTKQ